MKTTWNNFNKFSKLSPVYQKFQTNSKFQQSLIPQWKFTKMTKISYKVPQIFQKSLKCAENNPGSS